MTTDALLEVSDLPHRLPRFAQIDDADYAPALEAPIEPLLTRRGLT